jgi:hypothetical protein
MADDEDDVEMVSMIECGKGWASFGCWWDEGDGIFVEDEGVWDVVGIASCVMCCSSGVDSRFGR